MAGVTLTPAADCDIDAEFLYLAERNINVALRFLKATDDTFAQLAENPGIGALRHFNRTALVGVQVWAIRGFPNYLAFYQIVEDTIMVLRILHGARNIENILGQGAK